MGAREGLPKTGGRLLCSSGSEVCGSLCYLDMTMRVRNTIVLERLKPPDCHVPGALRDSGEALVAIKISSI